MPVCFKLLPTKTDSNCMKVSAVHQRTRSLYYSHVILSFVPILLLDGNQSTAGDLPQSMDSRRRKLRILKSVYLVLFLKITIFKFVSVGDKEILLFGIIEQHFMLPRMYF